MVILNNSQIDDKQKEYCAVSTMRRMLEKYSSRENISFETALLEFADSYTYEALFDFETDIWKEGPDYLMALYDEEKANKKN